MESMSTPRRLRPPRGMRRAMFRAPILLYRARLGWLLGRRMVLIEHRGRRSGRVRQVVVEVAALDRATGVVTVASGFGHASDWYRNLLATPQARICLGTRWADVRAEALTEDEGASTMVDYALRHPVAARVLARYMGATAPLGADAYRSLGTRVPFMRLVPLGHDRA